MPSAQLEVAIQEQLDRAARNARPVRLHTRDGEVLVARLLEHDALRLRCVVLTSSRPENYAVCDSTGHELALDALERVTLLTEDEAGRSGRPRRARG